VAQYLIKKKFAGIPKYEQNDENSTVFNDFLGISRLGNMP